MSDHRDLQSQIDELMRRQRRLTRVLAGLLIGIVLCGSLGAATAFDEDVTVRGLLTTFNLTVERQAEFESRVRMTGDLIVEGDLKVNGSMDLPKKVGGGGGFQGDLKETIESVESSLADLKEALEKQDERLTTVETKTSALDGSVADLERDLKALKQKAK